MCGFRFAPERPTVQATTIGDRGAALASGTQEARAAQEERRTLNIGSPCVTAGPLEVHPAGQLSCGARTDSCLAGKPSA